MHLMQFADRDLYRGFTFGRVLVGLFCIFFLFSYLMRDWFYRTVCYTGEGLINSPCSGFFQTYILDPVTAADALLLVLFAFLFLLPTFLLRGWFLFIAWWAVPFAVYAVATSPIGSDGFFSFSPRNEAEFMSHVLLYLTIGYVIAHVGVHLTLQLWRRG